MAEQLLVFWRPGPNVKLSDAEIARELLWGEEVEGLIDLPIREVLDRLKIAFPDHEEKSGLFVGRTGSGAFEATWTWQYFRVDTDGLTPDDRQRLIDVLEAFGCTYQESHGGP